MRTKSKQEELLTFSKDVEGAILSAEHASSIAFIENVIMGRNTKAQLLITTVGLVPKSEKAWEGILHSQLVVLRRQDGTITVYDIDPTVITPCELYSNFISNSEYSLPVGKGIKQMSK
jgi:hypothetical protein